MLSCFALIACIFPACAVVLLIEPVDAAERPVIVIGGNQAYPPYEFLDEEGNPAGYNVDLSKAIAEVMGMKISFRLGAWVDVRKALDNGTVDVLQGMSYSEGRAQVVDFSIPHTVVNHSIFSRVGVPPVDSFEALEGKEVAFHGRGFVHDYLAERNLNVRAVLTDTPADALRVVASGKHDYAVVASLPATFLIQQLHLTNVVPVARSVVSVKYCYAVKKGNTELLARFNEGLAILKQTGQYQVIYDKWLGVLEPRGISLGSIIKYGSLVTSLFLIALAGALLWSRTLKKQVAIRTADLEREVLERKRAAEELRLRQEQLVQADKMASLGVLVSGVAHEINNPNGLILLTIPIVAEAFCDARQVLDDYYRDHGDFELGGVSYSRIRDRLPLMLDDMHEGSKRIKRIVDDLKDFARSESGESMAPADLNIIAHAAIRLVDNSVRKSGCRFALSFAENLPLFRGNAQRIEQVVVNLILNACQAMEHQGTGKTIALETSAQPRDGTICLRVTDTGCGISAEDVPRVTDPFFTTKRNVGGTGLGLSVSAGIVKEHGGSLSFASDAGQGTSVSLLLPVLAAEVKKT